MGAACCIAARNTSLPAKSRNGESQRTDRYSPSWSCRWDSYRRVAGETENLSCHFGERTSTDVRIEMKDAASSGRCIIFDGSSALENRGTPVSHKSPSHGGINTNSMSPLGKTSDNRVTMIAYQSILFA